MISDQAGEQVYRGVKNTAKELSEWLMKLLDKITSIRVSTYKDKDAIDKGTKLIMAHGKNGGLLEKLEVPKEREEQLAKCLEEYRVPFSRMNVKDENGKNHSLFVIRDIDKPSVDLAWKRFSIISMEGLNQVTPGEFADLAQGQDVEVRHGLTREEMEVFRQKMAGRSGTYAFLEGEKGFDLYSLKKDHDSVDKSIKDMAYDLAGETGDQYRAQLKEDIQKRDEFLKNAVPEEGIVYVVDAKAPNNFLVVTKDGFSTHAIDKTQKGLKDIDGKTHIGHDNLLLYTQDLKAPVILRDFSLIEGFTRDGKAVLSPGFEESYNSVKAELSGMESFHGIRDKRTERKDRILTLDGLSSEQISKVYLAVKEEGLKDEVVVMQDSVAYPESLKDRVEPMLDKALYEDMSPLEKMQEELRLEGRGLLLTSAILEEKDAVYLIDAAAGRQNAVFKIDEKGMDVIDKGETIGHVDCMSSDFEKQLTAFYEAMKEPVVLTKDEMEGDKTLRNQAITEKLHPESEAKDFLEHGDSRKKEELYAHHDMNDPKIERMDSRQREALRYSCTLETTNITLDRDTGHTLSHSTQSHTIER